jgi:glutamate N-acetyltransferase / amino-acid N-acetyltransferase
MTASPPRSPIWWRNCPRMAYRHGGPAIMTTDTFPKGASAVIQGDGGPIRIAGIAKGSGMIAPDMATMLVYIFTDAKIGARQLQTMLSRNVDDTFNAITVDSDTSTSDALLLCATGQGLRPRSARQGRARLRGGPARRDDGSGPSGRARRRRRHEIRGNPRHRCRRRARCPPVAMAIANSPLVKTAIAGQDPNWGRIVAAIGKSARRPTATACPSASAISLSPKRAGAPRLPRRGRRRLHAAPRTGDRRRLGLGTAARSVWTCDLTHRYIDINADYRS